MSNPKENIERAGIYLGWHMTKDISVKDISDETGLSVDQILNSKDIIKLLKANKELKIKKRELLKQVREIDKKIRELK